MLTCGCDDPAEVWQPSRQKARKSYQCCECGYEVQPGEEYWRVFVVHCGDASTHKRCERCADLQEAFSDLGYCDYVGELFESYRDWLELELDLPNASERASAIQRKHHDWNAAI